jgi:hypothetical protein
MSLRSKYNREIFVADPTTGIYNPRSLNIMQTAFDATEAQATASASTIVLMKRDYNKLIKQLMPILVPKVVPATPITTLYCNLGDEYTFTWTTELYVLRVELVVDGLPITQTIDPKADQYIANVPIAQFFDEARKHITATVILHNIIGPSIPGTITINRWYAAPTITSVVRNANNKDRATLVYTITQPDYTPGYVGVEILVATENIDQTISYGFLEYYDNGSIPRPGTLENIDITAYPNRFTVSIRYVYDHGEEEALHADEDCSDLSELSGLPPRDEAEDEMNYF